THISRRLMETIRPSAADSHCHSAVKCDTAVAEAGITALATRAFGKARCASDRINQSLGTDSPGKPCNTLALHGYSPTDPKHERHRSSPAGEYYRKHKRAMYF
ncbi:MAG: hypothetical protein ABGX40_07535, partial [Methylococcales bacterium]